MLKLPAGFDVSLLISDYAQVALPFVAIALLIIAFSILKQASEVISKNE